MSTKFPYSKIMQLYPRLTRFDIPTCDMIVATSEILEYFMRHRTLDDEFTSIKFNNLVPYLKSFLDNSQSPAPIAFMTREEPNDDYEFEMQAPWGYVLNHDSDSDDEDIQYEMMMAGLQMQQSFRDVEVQVEDKGNSRTITAIINSYNIRPNTDSVNSKSKFDHYYDEEMAKNEYIFKSLVSRAESKNPKKIEVLYEEYSSSLYAFPKPNWTTYLTSLTIDLPSISSPSQQRLKIGKIYKLYQLDNYPSLRKVSINDKESKSWDFRRPIYESLMKCHKLYEISISFGIQPSNNTAIEMIEMVNRLRGTWKKFTLELKSGQNGDSWPLTINNPTITRFSWAFDSSFADCLVLDFNTDVFKSLKFNFEGEDFTEPPECFNLLKRHQYNLEQLEIHFRANCDRYKVLQTLNKILHNTNFPKLRNLKVRDDSNGDSIDYDFDDFDDFDDDEDGEYIQNPRPQRDTSEREDSYCRNEFEIKDSVAEYLTYFFSIVNFGKPFETFGQAANVLRKLKLMTRSSKNVKFSKKLLDSVRSLSDFKDFFQCYDHGASESGKSCCEKSISSYTVTALYCLFAYCFQQLVQFDKNSPLSEFKTHLRIAKVWDDLFLALCKSSPNLNTLNITSRLGGEEHAILPHFQQLYRKVKFYDLYIDLISFDWGKLILPSHPYTDEWISHTFQKTSIGHPDHIEPNPPYQHLVNYLKEVPKLMKR